MTRTRDRQGSLLVRGRKRKFWLAHWPEGDCGLAHKLGWPNEMNVWQAERARRQWMEKIHLHRDIAGDSATLDGFFREHDLVGRDLPLPRRTEHQEAANSPGYEDHNIAGLDSAAGQAQHCRIGSYRKEVGGR